ncbi:MAG: serine/threonine-protein kinase [Candidatus Sulfotelmatobacter sp.]
MASVSPVVKIFFRVRLMTFPTALQYPRNLPSMSSHSAPLDVGQTIGDYQILSLLGRGGMGKVFKVRNVISDRIEAMKVLLPDVDATPDLAERFVREIKLVATLDHPNIAGLRTALRSGSQMLMIMEYIDGQPLDQLPNKDQIQPHPPDPHRAVPLIMQVLAALSYAHQRGVIHRDVKPSNVLVRADGTVKLTDFGIASRAGDPRLTGPGMALGSLYYMSPEQIKAFPVDARSDIYSVGVTLYEIVTGRRPVQGDSLFSIMAAHLQQIPVPPIQLVPHIPPELSSIIERSLQKSPEDRFQSAEDFRAALSNVYPDVRPHVATTAPYRISSSTSALQPAPSTTPAAPPATPPSTQSFDPALLETVRKNLATYIGPMAKVIITRAAKTARSRQDLYEKLAEEIPSAKDRQTFLRSLPL